VPVINSNDNPKENAMASYVMLINWTDKGAHDFKDTIDSGKGLLDLASGNGGSVDRIVWTMGCYDAVAVVTAPDDETAATIALAASEKGSILTDDAPGV
jgi:uncharacterized protein with GYD domain